MSTISGVSSTSSAWANTSASRSQMQAKMFAKVDANSSGGVDKTELQSLMADVAKKSGVANSSSTDELFGKMDSNSDGSLSSDELDSGMQTLMPAPSTMDFAKQSAGGSPPPVGGGGGGGASSTSSTSTTFDTLDTNEDGVVSAQERMAPSTSTDPLQALFKAIDSDSDSKISGDESDAFIKQLTSQVEATTQSAQNTDTNASTTAKSKNDSFDLKELARQTYEQIASGLSQQAKGSTFSIMA